MGKLTILSIGPPETYGELRRLSKRDERHLLLRINTKQSSEVCVRRTRIFIGLKLIALSASLASLALWIAPELRGNRWTTN
jgi:hypothetical protein